VAVDLSPNKVILASVGEEMNDRQQNDRAQECYQHGWNSNRLIDCPNMEYGAQEVTGQERTNDSHDDIDQQVRAIVHDFSGHPTDHRDKSGCSFFSPSE
jgi:hypothetical protein